MRRNLGIPGELPYQRTELVRGGRKCGAREREKNFNRSAKESQLHLSFRSRISFCGAIYLRRLQDRMFLSNRNSAVPRPGNNNLFLAFPALTYMIRVDAYYYACVCVCRVSIDGFRQDDELTQAVDRLKTRGRQYGDVHRARD